MEVKIYREPENQELCINDEELEQYNALALELGLCTQKNADENKVPSMYICLNTAMKKQLHALCPRYVKIEDYKRSTIPLQVLQVYKFCKENEMYEGYQVWYDDVAPDPMLIGWKYASEEARLKNYTWQKDHYLIARWGDCALELDELLALAFNKVKQQLIDNVQKAIVYANSILANPEAHVRDILAANGKCKLDINTTADDTVY